MAQVPKEEDMSSYKEGQVHQLMEKFEAENFTAEDLTKLGQYRNLFGVRGLLRGTHKIVEAEKPPIFARLYPNEEILVSATNGTETIANSGKIFTGFLDKDFENWGTNKSSGWATESSPAEVYELRQNATFREIFGSLNRNINSLCWEQGQIIKFVQEHRDKLHPKGWGTFFLFNVEGEEEPFVASVSLDSGELKARVYRFGYGYVCFAETRYRVVVPQLNS